MSKDLSTLNLKTPLSDKKLVGVVFHKNITVFGMNTGQIGISMTNLSMRWDNDNKRVIVTSVADNGLNTAEEWIHEAAIAKTVWK